MPQSADPCRERICTGVSGFDRILGGGLTRGHVVLLEGGPGTGKTSLALELVYRGATSLGEPGLFITFERPPHLLARDAMSFGWDLDGAQARGQLRLIQTSPAVLLQELTTHDGALMSQIRAMGARRIVIDGLAPLRQVLPSTCFSSFQDLLGLLTFALQRQGVTLILTSETSPEGGAGEERHLCDLLLALGQSSRHGEPQRTLTVVKARGQSAAMGRHTLRIEDGHGVRVYPRYTLAADAAATAREATTPLSSGLDGLDELLGGGLAPGSTTLIIGAPRAGKTLAALQILMHGACRGEAGLLVALDEPPPLLEMRAAHLALAACVAEGSVAVLHEPPSSLELDVLFHRLGEQLAARAPRRVVIDALPLDLARTTRERLAFAYALTSLARSRQVAMVATTVATKAADHFGRFVDNVVRLHYVEEASRAGRVLSLRKATGKRQEPRLRSVLLTERGLHLDNEPRRGARCSGDESEAGVRRP